jgi:hypothetical protein
MDNSFLPHKKNVAHQPFLICEKKGFQEILDTVLIQLRIGERQVSVKPCSKIMASGVKVK